MIAGARICSLFCVPNYFKIVTISNIDFVKFVKDFFFLEEWAWICGKKIELV